MVFAATSAKHIPPPGECLAVRNRTVTLVFAIVLSGCLGLGNEESRETTASPTPNPGDPPIDPPIGNGDNETVDDAWTLVDCTGLPISIYTAATVVDENVPDGYYGRSLVGEGVSSTFVLDSFQCGSILIGNHTLIRNVHFTIVSASAWRTDPPPDVPTFSFYNYEWHVDNATLADALAASGFVAYQSTIAYSYDVDDLNLAVTVDGVTWIANQGMLGEGTGPTTPFGYTQYRETPDGTRMAILQLDDGRGKGLAYRTQTTIAGGMLAQILPHAGPWLGEAVSGPVSGTISFRMLGEQVQ